jgi:hypothetical protein
MDIPLFHKALSQEADITDPARPNNVPDRLRRRVLCDDTQRGVGASYYGPGNSLVIYINHKPLNPYEIQVCDLAGTEGAWANTPVQAPFAAAIDPQLGRLALPAVAPGTHAPTAEISYEYGFNADLGGGEYARAAIGNGNPGFLVTNPAWIVPFPDNSNGCPLQRPARRDQLRHRRVPRERPHRGRAQRFPHPLTRRPARHQSSRRNHS